MPSSTMFSHGAASSHSSTTGVLQPRWSTRRYVTLNTRGRYFPGYAPAPPYWAVMEVQGQQEVFMLSMNLMSSSEQHTHAHREREREHFSHLDSGLGATAACIVCLLTQHVRNEGVVVCPMLRLDLDASQ